jgi:hypothetical protein
LIDDQRSDIFLEYAAIYLDFCAEKLCVRVSFINDAQLVIERYPEGFERVSQINVYKTLYGDGN